MRVLDPNTGRLRYLNDRPRAFTTPRATLPLAIGLGLGCWAVLGLLIWAGTWLGHSGALP